MLQRWKKGIGGAKTAAILKLSTDGAIQPAGGGLLGMLSKAQKKEETTDEDSDGLSSSESEDESSSMEEEDENQGPAPQTSAVSSNGSSNGPDQSSDSESDTGSSSMSDGDKRAAGRGRGRGGGRAGRGRWSRGSRASFNRGRGAGRSAARAAVAPVGGLMPQAMKKSVKPQLKAAALLAKVQNTVPAPAAESSDDLTTSSDDDELEQLAQEVKRFEKMMHKKIAVPGFVPVFTEPERGKGASEHLNLDTIMQKRILKRERLLYNPDEEDLMQSIAGYEMTEMEKLAQAGKQQHSGDDNPTKDASADIPANATSSSQGQAPAPARGAQKILSETDEDIEIEVGGETYLVDLESGLVFHLVVSSSEPPEVGTWDAQSRLIKFA